MPDTHIPTTVAPQLGGGTRLPAEIAQAIGQVMTGIKSLPKSEHNGHAGYAFASIDAFLAAVGPLCSAAGLIVFQDEDTVDVFDRGGKGWLKITYSFTLAHISGVMAERPVRRTVLQQITGPQTTGSSQSYALKQFMRSLFQIPTGDRDDADFQPKTEMQAAGKPQERVERPDRADAPSASQAIQKASGESEGPTLMKIETGRDGLLVGKWVTAAKNALIGKPEAWRRDWIELHGVEIEEVRRVNAEWASKLEAIAIAPDLAPLPNAAE